jgi:glycosyltransferase involved in cell wall biosynthesis
MTPKISLCIPYHQKPQTAHYLGRLLKSIAQQDFKDYEIVLTDEGNFARNHNAAIMKARGEYVQMLQMDDYFPFSYCLGKIVEGLESSQKEWQITACLHDLHGSIGNMHYPKWTDDIWTGNNRLGSVSTLSFRRENALFFEEPLTWLVDVDLYYRLYLKYGLPNLLESANVCINVTDDRLTSTLSDELKANEVEYLHKKYAR